VGLTELASELLASDDASAQPDAFRFAWICDLSLRVEDGDPRLVGSWICYDATRSERQQQHDVAACVAEWMLRSRCVPVTAFAVEYLVGQMLATRSRARMLAAAPAPAATPA